MAKGFDRKAFEEAQNRAYALRDDYGVRNEQIIELQKAYTLKDEAAEKLKSQFENIVLVKSPMVANAVDTGVRILCNNPPGFNVPPEMHKQAGDVLDDIERACAMMLRASDRARGHPLQNDAAKTGLLYDEIIISVNRTEDMLQYVGEDTPTGRRLKRIADGTPFLFDVVNPSGCYYTFDFAGVDTFVRVVNITAQEIINRWGNKGKNQLGDPDAYKLSDKFNVWHYWDLNYYFCWIEEKADPLGFRKWNLSFLPWVVHIVEGSRMWNDYASQRHPFLYTALKSGVISAQSLTLSAKASRVRNRMWAAFDYEADDDQPNPKVDLKQPINFVRHPPGTTLKALPTDQADDELFRAYSLFDSLGEQSTIFKQVGGQPIGAERNYSETLLLNTSGQLPLEPTKKKLAWALGDAMKIAFQWMKEQDGPGEQGSYSISERGTILNIDPAEVPDDLEIEVDLDPFTKAQRLQQAVAFGQLKDSYPLEDLLQHVMGEKQPKQVIRRLYVQRLSEMVFNALGTVKVQQYVMQLQQQMAQNNPQLQPGGGPPPDQGGGPPQQPNGPQIPGTMNAPGVPSGNVPTVQAMGQQQVGQQGTMP